MGKSQYSQAFYAGQVQGSCVSANRIIPVIVELLHPSTVLDIGCGLGGWLAEFIKAGCRVRGVDGSHVEQTCMKIPEDAFIAENLEHCARDRRIPGLDGQRFSLCISLEVAEHIAPRFADAFLQLLTEYSDYVLFSAAIPHQGGTHHVNEQWPDYWITRFAAMDYTVHDILRPRIWEDQAIEPWYRQNTMLFVKNGCDFPCGDRNETSMPTRVVHPDFFLRCIDYFYSQEHLRQWPSVLLVRELMHRARQGVTSFLKYPLHLSVKHLKHWKGGLFR